MVIGQSIENKMRRRLVDRQTRLKRIINETNRASLVGLNAKFELGLYGAYITLETWQEIDSGDPNDPLNLHNGILRILGMFTGISSNVLSNIFRGGNGLRGPRQAVISDTVPPIIERNLNAENGQNKVEKATPARIEIGGIPSTDNGEIFSSLSSGNARVSHTPKPYVPSAFKISKNMRAKNDDKEEESVFDAKGGNRIRIDSNNFEEPQHSIHSIHSIPEALAEVTKKSFEEEKEVEIDSEFDFGSQEDSNNPEFDI